MLTSETGEEGGPKVSVGGATQDEPTLEPPRVTLFRSTVGGRHESLHADREGEEGRVTTLSAGKGRTLRSSEVRIALP